MVKKEAHFQHKRDQFFTAIKITRSQGIYRFLHGPNLWNSAKATGNLATHKSGDVTSRRHPLQKRAVDSHTFMNPSSLAYIAVRSFIGYTTRVLLNNTRRQRRVGGRPRLSVATKRAIGTGDQLNQTLDSPLSEKINSPSITPEKERREIRPAVCFFLASRRHANKFKCDHMMQRRAAGRVH